MTAEIRQAQQCGLESLLFDLVEWINKEPRTYAEVMDAWRTSCPRLAVWEEALDRGYVVRCPNSNGTTGVKVTKAGRAFLSLLNACRKA
jgi:hypothetical protein